MTKINEAAYEKLAEELADLNPDLTDKALDEIIDLFGADYLLDGADAETVEGVWVDITNYATVATLSLDAWIQYKEDEMHEKADHLRKLRQEDS